PVLLDGKEHTTRRPKNCTSDASRKTAIIQVSSTWHLNAMPLLPVFCSSCLRHRRQQQKNDVQPGSHRRIPLPPPFYRASLHFLSTRGQPSSVALWTTAVARISAYHLERC
ncbi:unnamed protein product, partial [Pylaiella littoralis]